MFPAERFNVGTLTVVVVVLTLTRIIKSVVYTAVSYPHSIFV